MWFFIKSLIITGADLRNLCRYAKSCSKKKFPRPFLCRFHLPNEIKIDPAKWEVALQEIQFSHSWFNIRKGYNKLHKIYHELDLKDKNDIEESYPYHIIPISSTSMIREIRMEAMSKLKV